MSSGNPNADPGMPQGFLLSGDAEAMAAMTPDRVEMLREMVGGLGLTLTAQYEQHEPWLVDRAEFLRISEEAGLNVRVGAGAWNTLEHTDWRHRRNDLQPPLPPLMTERRDGRRKILDLDLRAIEPWLNAHRAGEDGGAWWDGGHHRARINFLGQFLTHLAEIEQ